MKPTDVAIGTDLSEADKQCLAAERAGSTPSTLELTPDDISQIIAVGKQVWKLIEDNKPVVNVKADRIAVLPVKAECWRFLENWQNPTVKTYRSTFKNLFGMTVVDLQYKVVGLTGGTYRGKGKYLANVAVVPEIVDVAWGYTFNASVSVPAVVNFGTMADPVAAVQIELSYSVDTVMKHSSSSLDYLVKGNGETLAL